MYEFPELTEAKTLIYGGDGHIIHELEESHYLKGIDGIIYICSKCLKQLPTKKSLDIHMSTKEKESIKKETKVNNEKEIKINNEKETKINNEKKIKINNEKEIKISLSDYKSKIKCENFIPIYEEKDFKITKIIDLATKQLLSFLGLIMVKSSRDKTKILYQNNLDKYNFYILIDKNLEVVGFYTKNMESNSSLSSIIVFPWFYGNGYHSLLLDFSYSSIRNPKRNISVKSLLDEARKSIKLVDFDDEARKNIKLVDLNDSFDFDYYDNVKILSSIGEDLKSEVYRECEGPVNNYSNEVYRECEGPVNNYSNEVYRECEGPVNNYSNEVYREYEGPVNNRSSECSEDCSNADFYTYEKFDYPNSPERPLSRNLRLICRKYWKYKVIGAQNIKEVSRMENISIEDAIIGLEMNGFDFNKWEILNGGKIDINYKGKLLKNRVITLKKPN